MSVEWVTAKGWKRAHAVEHPADWHYSLCGIAPQGNWTAIGAEDNHCKICERLVNRLLLKELKDEREHAKT